MMRDRNRVAVRPASVWRVLQKAGRLDCWNRQPSCQGAGFQPPRRPQEHGHTAVSSLHIAGTFYYLGSLLDGYTGC